MGSKIKFYKKQTIIVILTLILLFSFIGQVSANNPHTSSGEAIAENSASNSANDASISEKKELYEQYQAAVNEAIEKYNARIELKPFEEFNFSIAEPIDQFKAVLKAIGESKWHNATSKLNSSNAMTLEEYKEEVKKRLLRPDYIQTETHTDTVVVGATNVTIEITGKFETYYSDYHKRQLISVSSYIDDISSATSNYTWATNYLDEGVSDSGRSYYVAAQGYVEHDNMIWYDLEVSTYFYCDSYGDVY